MTIKPILYKVDKVFGLSKIVNYIIVGGLSAAINFIAFSLLWDLLHVNYKIAVTISYLLAILFNFTSNRFITFKCGGQYLIPHLYRYITMIIINYSITLLTLHGVVEFLHQSPYLGLLASIAITAITGFTLSRFWVFR